MPFQQLPVDGIHPIAVCGSYKESFYIRQNSHKFPFADWDAVQHE